MNAFGGQSEFLLFHLTFNNALPSSDRPDSYVALQRRTPNGRRWDEVARFLSNTDAKAALTSLVEGGHADAAELRVRRVTVPGNLVP